MFVCEDPIKGDRACNRRHDHEHDAPARRGPGLALGTPHSGQVHVGRRDAARLPRHRLQRPLGIPARTSPRTSGRKAQPRSRTSSAARTGLSAEEGKTGTIIWTMRSPYVFVGGRLEAEGSGASVCRLPGRQEVGGRGTRTWTSSSRRRARHATSINSAASSPAGPGSSDWRSSTICRWPCWRCPR